MRRFGWQREITMPGPVLDEKGLVDPGYSTKEVLTYNRKAIKALPWRIKEWDFYQIEDVSGRFCLQLTYGHASYVGQIGVMLFDIKKKEWLVKKSVLIPFPFGRMHLPESAEKNSRIRTHRGNTYVCFDTKNGVRDLTLRMGDFYCRIVLTPLIDDALVITIPFAESEKDFYYNYKKNGMKAEGEIRFTYKGKRKKIVLGGEPGEKADRSGEMAGKKTAQSGEVSCGSKKHAVPAMGLLDWGRGVWPFSNTWFWSNGAGYVTEPATKDKSKKGELKKGETKKGETKKDESKKDKKKLFGFNLGCGFGDTTLATENILFYEGKTHKLGEVRIVHRSDYMEPWILRDDDGRLDLTMTPEFDRITRDKVAFIDNCTHQVFGKFNGTAVLDDGRVIEIRDLPAFAEHAVNNW